MKISIITVVKNNLPGLRRTLECIKEQTYQNWECIIIDAEMCGRVFEYVDAINDGRIRLVQDFDDGIYDGMNKGLRYSTGNIVNFLNTDDVYASNKVLEIIAALYEFLPKNSKYLIKGMADSDDVPAPERLTKISLFRRCPNHQSVFYSRKAIGQGYAKELKLAGDWAHFFENFNELLVVYLDVIIINYKRGGRADNSRAHLLAWRERLLHVTKLSKASLVVRLPYILISILGIIYSCCKLALFKFKKDIH